MKKLRLMIRMYLSVWYFDNLSHLKNVALLSS